MGLFSHPRLSLHTACHHHRLHNLDQNVPVPLSAMEMKRVEWTYYRHDLVSISSILT